MAPAVAGERTLKETPTWAVALVCGVFVIASILIEHGIESLAKWFKKKQKKAMSEALEKIKAELMLLGFISLLLTVGTRFIPLLCIPADLGSTMLPCKRGYKKGDGGYGGSGSDDDGDKGDVGGDRRRKLFSYAEDMVLRRILAAPAGGNHCSKPDQVPLISQTGVHQLHIFIFVLAVFHVLYSVITMALAQAKMKKWKSWESETSSLEYQFTNDPARFRFTHQTSFVRRHAGWSRTPGIRWIVAFFRQFFASVTKVDYITMRHGFINAHLAPNSNFNFHKYIKRSMEDDFKVVVGISISLWVFAIIFLLLNVYKWYALSWMQILPVMIILLVGTKLELIIMEMAQEIQDRTTVVKGAPIVEPSNKFFWFNRPHWILLLIHFILFQNAFQMAFFLWITYEYGIKSCFHDNLAEMLVRLACGVALQILCSYITFPLYALVTQMGSHMKKSIFEEQTATALKKWQKAAKERRKLRKAGGGGGGGGGDNANASVSVSVSGENTPSHGSSPLHLLHNHKYKSSTATATATATANEVESAPNSPKSYLSDADFSEIEDSSHHRHHRTREDNGHLDTNHVDSHSIDFSFSRA